MLRRILRRAVRFARKAGIEGTFLGDLSQLVIEKMAHQYPELERERATVLSVIQAEEERFGQTLQQGIRLLEAVIGKEEGARALRTKWRAGLPQEAEEVAKLSEAERAFLADAPDHLERLGGLLPEPGVISGATSFKLYDTFGFPLDITIDVAREHGMTVDVEGFERELEAQRERGRAAAKFGLGDKPSADAYRGLAFDASVFRGYESTESETTLIALLVNGAPVDRVTDRDAVEVVLRETPFYAEAGGQVGDQGGIIGPHGTIFVTSTSSPVQGLIVHAGDVLQGEFAVGEPVKAKVDAVRRADVMRNHTGTHLLHAALRRVLGTHVRQAGSLVAPDRLRFDFSHPSGLSGDELREIERMVNGRILDNLPVVHQQMGFQEAIDNGALAFFGDKYGDVVRTCRIGAPGAEAFSFELCGGTHTAATGEIGLLHVESEGSIGAGTRRIEAVTGRGTEGVLSERHVLMESLAKQLQTAPSDLQSRLAAVLDDLDRERKRASALERDLAKRQTDGLTGGAQDVDGVAVLASEVTVSTMDALRGAADSLRGRIQSGVIVLGSVIDGKPAFVATVSKDLTAEGYHAGNIIREVAKVAGGGGGGRPDMAQAGGKDASKLAEALALAPELVKRR